MFQFRKNYYADVRIEDRQTTDIAFNNRVLNTSKQLNERKAFLRVFDGEMWYYASTSDVDNVQAELELLYLSATENKDVDSNPVVKLFEVNVDEKMVYLNTNVRNVPFDKKLEKLKTAMSYLKSEKLALSQCVYTDRNSVFEFYSSKGAKLKYDYQTVGLRIAGVYADGESKAMNMVDGCSFDFDNVNVTREQIEEMEAESENFIKNAVPCEQGIFPVVLSNVTTGVFAHESFGHKSESDFMLGDETMAKEWQIGKRVGSPLLTICECGEHKGSGYTPYDDEGTKCKMTYLVKEGVLQGRLHSATTAAYLNEQLTGNARAISCDFEPIVRMTNTYIAGGKSTKEELFAGIKDGYYVKMIKHGSGMSTFTIAPEIAYRIRDGKIAEPVRIGVITGNVFETLGLIDGVADDFQLLSFVTGGCGKMEQFPLPVGMGGPHIRVSKINVQ